MQKITRRQLIDHLYKAGIEQSQPIQKSKCKLAVMTLFNVIENALVNLESVTIKGVVRLVPCYCPSNDLSLKVPGQGEIPKRDRVKVRSGKDAPLTCVSQRVFKAELIGRIEDALFNEHGLRPLEASPLAEEIYKTFVMNLQNIDQETELAISRVGRFYRNVEAFVEDGPILFSSSKHLTDRIELCSLPVAKERYLDATERLDHAG
ncbi:hypothetical protein AB6D11_19230 [Vibrio splendidus]